MRPNYESTLTEEVMSSFRPVREEDLTEEQRESVIRPDPLTEPMVIKFLKASGLDEERALKQLDGTVAEFLCGEIDRLNNALAFWKKCTLVLEDRIARVSEVSIDPLPSALHRKVLEDGEAGMRRLEDVIFAEDHDDS